jgi:CRISPR system Cascade subunit CasE
VTTLTRIRLNRMHPAVRRDLADREELHKTTMRLLPDNARPTPRAHGCLLFCLEPGLEAVLLVQTADPPHLAGLPGGYGTADTLDLAAMFAALAPGLAVRYRITAAPAAATSSPPDPATGRRRNTKYPLTGQAAQAWWQRRAAAAGLHLLGKNTATPCPFPLARTRSGPGPYHRLVRFEGTATVTDAAAVAHAVQHGIGRGKSYGAGLLCLAPA